MLYWQTQSYIQLSTDINCQQTSTVCLSNTCTNNKRVITKACACHCHRRLFTKVICNSINPDNKTFFLKSYLYRGTSKELPDCHPTYSLRAKRRRSASSIVADEEQSNTWLSERHVSVVVENVLFTDWWRWLNVLTDDDDDDDVLHLAQALCWFCQLMAKFH